MVAPQGRQRRECGATAAGRLGFSPGEGMDAPAPVQQYDKSQFEIFFIDKGYLQE